MSSKNSTTHSGASAPVVAATQYTCPMHPDVVSDKLGDCPKCGMHLVPLEEGGDKAHSGDHHFFLKSSARKN
jgi:Cu+-exporting ATPase